MRHFMHPGVIGRHRSQKKPSYPPFSA
jgi:hypothetical protein